MRFLILCPLLLIPCSAAKPYTPRFSQITAGNDFYGKWKVKDVDGDGLADLVQIGRFNAWGGISRNLGNRSFSPTSISHFGEGQDGHYDGTTHLLELDGSPGPELFFCLEKSPPETFTPMMVKQGNAGQYGKRIPLAPEGSTPWIPIDIDGDGEARFLSSPPEDGHQDHLTLWERQPDGSYAAMMLPVGGEIGSFANALAADLDHDGDLDLVLEDSYQTRVVERTGSRAFGAVSASYDSYQFSEPSLTDLNGDGLPEIHSAAGELRWRINQGGRLFGPESGITDFVPSLSGWDLLKVENQPGAPAVLHFVKRDSTTLRLKSIRFTTWQVLSDTTVPLADLNPYEQIYGNWASALEDLDNDGRLDLLVPVSTEIPLDPIYGRSYLQRLAVAWGTGDGFGPAVFVDPPPLSHRFTLIDDFNRDGSKDLILGPDVAGRFALLANTGDGTFAPPAYLPQIPPPAGSPAGTIVTAIHAADFDGDSILDLVVDYAAPFYFLYRTTSGIARGNGDGTFSAPVLPDGAFDTITDGALGINQLIDWDKDGDLDAISGGDLRENLGGRFSAETRPLMEGAYITDFMGNPVKMDRTHAGDVDGDGFPDIVALTYQAEAGPSRTGGSLPTITSKMAIGYNDGTGGIASIAVVPINITSVDILGNPVTGNALLADVNEDGLLDLCTTEPSGSDILGNPLFTNRWRRNPGGGSRNPSEWVMLPLGDDQTAATPADPFLDFDGDGSLEWVTPTGYLSPTPQGPVPSPTYNFTGRAFFGYNSVIYCGDFDGDGDADFLAGDGSATMILVKNPTVDQRSAITRHLLKAGVKGSLAGPDKDADGDGLSNESELLFGTDPESAGPSAQNALALSLAYQPGASVLSFRKPAYADNLKLDYQVEHSTDLGEWTPVGGALPMVTGKDSRWQSLSLPLSCSGPCGFYRIKATHTVDEE